MSSKKYGIQPEPSDHSDTVANPARRLLMGEMALAGVAFGLLGPAPRALARGVTATQAPGVSLSTAQERDPSDGLQARFDLMPWPAKVAPLGEEVITLPERIAMRWSSAASPRAKRAAERFTRRVEARSSVRFSFDHPAAAPLVIRISFRRPGQLRIGEDESYTLQLKQTGIQLDAATDLGVAHGLATLDQLLTSSAGSRRLSCYPVLIADQPRFQWRGLMIDCARHFQPLPVLRRNLRAMEAMKLNVLHLHLSDNQGFRVQSRSFPKLTSMGSNGEFYTQDQIKALIAYAADRGIVLVPEFDMPSHAVSWFVGYPELASAPGPYALYTHFGGQMASFDPTNARVYAVLDRFFGEMAALFDGDYIHIGGDENSGVQWSHNPYIQAFMHTLHAPPIKSNPELQALFTNRVSHIVAKHGKTPIGWDEVLQPGVQKDIIIQSWRGSDALVKAAASGDKALLSHGYYLDLYDFTSDYYLNDPIPAGTSIDAKAESNILGGEAEMWSELASPDIIDSRIWPNMAAISERLWSPATVRNVDAMYARLRVVERQLAALGLTHLSGPATILRQLGDSDRGTSALTQLAGLVSPIRGYQRSRKPYTTTTPFNAFVDATVTPAWGAIAFDKMVDAVGQNPDQDEVKAVRATLESWQRLASTLDELTRRSETLADLAPFAPSLAALAKVGLDACDYLRARKTAPVGWARAVTNDLIAADTVHADVRLRVVASVCNLAAHAVAYGRSQGEV